MAMKSLSMHHPKWTKELINLKLIQPCKNKKRVKVGTIWRKWQKNGIETKITTDNRNERDKTIPELVADLKASRFVFDRCNFLKAELQKFA